MMLEHDFMPGIDKRAHLARFLVAALSHFRANAEAAGLNATVKALDAVVCAIDVDVRKPTRH